MKKTRVGVIGCGDIARKAHIPCLLKIPEVDLVSVCDIDQQRSLGIAKTFGISSSFTDAASMFKKESLDLVHICVPPRFHLDLTLMAMDAGCNVLVEKPLVLKLSEAEEIVDKSKKSGLRFSVIHNFLFSPEVVKLKKIVNEGALGKIVSVNTFWDSLDQRDAPMWYFKGSGGRFGEGLPHPIYLILEFIKNLKVLQVNVKKLGHTLTPPYVKKEDIVFDELYVTLDGTDAFGSISFTLNSKRPSFMIVSGTKGTVLCSPSNMQLRKLSLDGGDLASELSGLAGEATNLASIASWRLRRGKIKSSSHFQQIDAFIKSIRSNSEPPISAEQAMEVTRIYQEIVECVDSMALSLKKL